MYLSEPARLAFQRLQRKHAYTGFRHATVNVSQMFNPDLLEKICKAIIVSDLCLLTGRRVYIKIIKLYFPISVSPTEGTVVKCKLYSTVK